MPQPGFEPGLPRPQRGVLTTRRLRLKEPLAKLIFIAIKHGIFIFIVTEQNFDK